MRFSGKISIVTGAAKGIGLAIAQRLAAEGAQVIMADIDGTALREALSGIQGNAVCPGTTWTPLVEAAVAREPDPEAARRFLEQSRLLNRLGKPDEIAAAVAFLTSDEVEYATGAVLSVDGGYTAQ